MKESGNQRDQVKKSFLITAHRQFRSFIRMSVICYPHKPPLSTKQVATLKFHDLSFAKQTSKPSFSSYSGFADTSQPLDFGLCYVFPAGEKYGGVSSHFIHRLKIAIMKTRSRCCGEYLKLVWFYFLLILLSYCLGGAIQKNTWPSGIEYEYECVSLLRLRFWSNFSLVLFGKGQNCIEQLWQIQVKTWRNPCTNFDKSM